MIKQCCQQKINSIEALIFKDIIDSHINHNELVSVNNMLKEYDVINQAIKIPMNFNSDNEHACCI